ncbi:MAG TPA: c-type cytochrome [Gammaproteobacteria bacterium]|nr:c-type cytochrome [Gammaproteobacteria bacterium]
MNAANVRAISDLRRQAWIAWAGRRLAWLAAGVLAFSGPAMGADGQSIVMQGNGKGAPACMACHGARGQGNPAGGFPMLAGMSETYLAKQLHDFQNGTRTNATMGPIAKALSPQEVQAVARYFSQQTPPGKAPGATAGSDLVREGRNLVHNGEWGKSLPACVRCHGPGAHGIAPHFPPIAGQGAGYLEKQLKAFQNGTRRNDAGEMMRSVADRLTATQIKAVAEYLASRSPQVGDASSAQ